LVASPGFSGRLHQKCYDATTDPPTLVSAQDDYCSLDSDGNHCPTGAVCLARAPNPGAGLWSFDNIGNAFFAAFVAITREGWTIPLYAAMQAVSGGTVIYFLLLIIVVSLFASQLVHARASSVVCVF